MYHGTPITGLIPPGFTYANDVKSLGLGQRFDLAELVPHAVCNSVETFQEKLDEIPAEVENVVNPIEWASDIPGRFKPAEPVSTALKPRATLLAKELEDWKRQEPEGVILQYVDDILIATKTEDDWIRLTIIEEVYSSRSDLKDVPLENPDWELFTDGNSFTKNDKRMTGYSVTRQDKVIEAKALPADVSSQKAILVALTRALDLSKGKKAKFHTELHLDRSKNFQFLRFKRSRRKEFRPNIPLAHWIYNGL
ncbi:hypothetical protein DUI87_30968 [Hirundo rustica rustica]|uniref:RNase H type-1 domain-containing protein n=1 Tax=Hirundo rustica rustica TaxID=333673 RepID=A0A3M0J1J8_HIRRU|nr:hypothetical protein DUI87_30968 [Hirundo rustica rustica]